jgi:hypothetical protein
MQTNIRKSLPFTATDLQKAKSNLRGTNEASDGETPTVKTCSDMPFFSPCSDFDTKNGHLSLGVSGPRGDVNDKMLKDIIDINHIPEDYFKYLSSSADSSPILTFPITIDTMGTGFVGITGQFARNILSNSDLIQFTNFTVPSHFDPYSTTTTTTTTTSTTTGFGPTTTPHSQNITTPFPIPTNAPETDPSHVGAIAGFSVGGVALACCFFVSIRYLVKNGFTCCRNLTLCPSKEEKMVQKLNNIKQNLDNISAKINEDATQPFLTAGKHKKSINAVKDKIDTFISSLEKENISINPNNPELKNMIDNFNTIAEKAQYYDDEVNQNHTTIAWTERLKSLKKD